MKPRYPCGHNICNNVTNIYKWGSEHPTKLDPYHSNIPLDKYFEKSVDTHSKIQFDKDCKESAEISAEHENDEEYNTDKVIHTIQKEVNVAGLKHFCVVIFLKNFEGKLLSK